MPKRLQLALAVACVVGFAWPFFAGTPRALASPSILQCVMFGEVAAVLYGFSHLPPTRRGPKAAAVAAAVALPVALAMLFR